MAFFVGGPSLDTISSLLLLGLSGINLELEVGRMECDDVDRGGERGGASAG